MEGLAIIRGVYFFKIFTNLGAGNKSKEFFFTFFNGPPLYNQKGESNPLKIRIKGPLNLESVNDFMMLILNDIDT